MSNTKLLLTASLLVIITGLSFLWVGLRYEPQPIPSFTSIQTPSPQSFPEATTSATFGIEGQRVLVTKVIDGDTIEIDDGIRVRLLGIDTPETKDPRKSVECFGKEAARETKNLIEGKMVVLQKDISETDKYGRLLRYIYLPLENGQTLFVNDYLIREGFAKALTYPPDVKYTDQFLEAQRQAKEGKKGLWNRC